MRNLLLAILALALNTGYSQLIKATTKGKNAPIVVAQKVSIQYGVHISVVYELLNIYKNKGASPGKQLKQTKELLQKFNAVVKEKHARKETLTDIPEKIGVGQDTRITDALNWQIFLQTQGANSPVIYAVNGTVNIWYGLTHQAFMEIFTTLESQKLVADKFKERLDLYMNKIAELNTKVRPLLRYDNITRQAFTLANKGKVVKAEQILMQASLPGSGGPEDLVAQRQFVLGIVRELLFKFDAAETALGIAVYHRTENVQYLLAYGTRLYENNKITQGLAQLRKALIVCEEKNALKKFGVECYTNIGRLFSHIAGYDSSVFFYSKALQIADKKNKEKYSTLLNELGIAFFNASAFDSADHYISSAAKIYTAIYQPGDSRMADINNSLGMIKVGQGKFADSRTCFRKALSIMRVLGDSLSPGIAIFNSNLGTSFKEEQLYDSALFYYQRALYIDTIIFKVPHPSLSKDYNNISVTYGELNQCPLSIQYIKKSIEFDPQGKEMKGQEIAKRLHNLSTTYSNCGQNDSALYYADESLKALNNASAELGLIHAAVYKTKSAIFSTGNIHDSSVYYQKKASRIENFLLETDHPNLIENYINIAIAYNLNSEYDSARIYFEKVDQQTLVGNMKIYFNMIFAVHYYLTGDVDSSFHLIKSALQTDSLLYKSFSPFAINLHSVILSAYLSKGSIANAAFHAHTILTILSGNNYPESIVGDAALYLVDYYTAVNDPDSAEYYLNWAYKPMGSYFSSTDMHAAKCYSLHARVFKLKNMIDSSIVYAEKGLAIRLKSLGSNNPGIAKDDILMGKLCLEKGDKAKALLHFKRAFIALNGKVKPYQSDRIEAEKYITQLNNLFSANKNGK